MNSFRSECSYLYVECISYVSNILSIPSIQHLIRYVPLNEILRIRARTTNFSPHILYSLISRLTHAKFMNQSADLGNGNKKHSNNFKVAFVWHHHFALEIYVCIIILSFWPNTYSCWVILMQIHFNFLNLYQSPAYIHGVRIGNIQYDLRLERV